MEGFGGGDGNPHATGAVDGGASVRVPGAVIVIDLPALELPAPPSSSEPSELGGEPAVDDGSTTTAALAEPSRTSGTPTDAETRTRPWQPLPAWVARYLRGIGE
jgi:hypothetical protein